MSEPDVSAERLARADALLERGVQDGLFTHAVMALARRGEPLALRAFGQATPETIFDLASLTKPLATAVCLLQLAEQGALHLRQTVARFFEPEFGPQPHLSDVDLRHLLTHTSGLPPIPRWPGAGADRAEILRSILATPTLRPPGAGYTYSDTGYLLLGEIIERAAGVSLSRRFAETVAGPLGISTLGFLPDEGNLGRIAPTTREETPGIVHDPRARALGGAAGHAGLFGTAADVLACAEAIRTGGPPLLSRAAARRMASSQIPPPLGGQSYGWFCAGNDLLPQGDFFSDRAYGHSGFTGTLVLIDPEFETTLVLLTNRVIHSEHDGSRFLRLRRFWLNAMAAAL